MKGRPSVLRRNVAAAGLVGAAVGAGLAAASLRVQGGDPLLLGLLGLGASITVAILLTPIYIGLAGEERRLLAAVEAGLAQVAMSIASWAAFYASVRGFE